MILVIETLLICACVFAAADVDVASVFRDSKIIEDGIIDVAPSETLEVYYDGKPLTPGETWKPYDARNIPIVTWPNDPDKYYTLIQIVPDVPSRVKPSMRNLVSWLVVNIPGNDLCKGQTLTVYSGCGCGQKPDVDLYRVIFTLHEQPAGKIEFDEPYNGDRKIGNRLSWSHQNFLAKYQLSPAVRGNMYFSDWDEYGSKLTKEFIAGKRSQNLTTIVEYEHCQKV